jgi:hypothetical protein
MEIGDIFLNSVALAEIRDILKNAGVIGIEELDDGQLLVPGLGSEEGNHSVNLFLAHHYYGTFEGIRLWAPVFIVPKASIKTSPDAQLRLINSLNFNNTQAYRLIWGEGPENYSCYIDQVVPIAEGVTYQLIVEFMTHFARVADILDDVIRDSFEIEGDLLREATPAASGGKFCGNCGQARTSGKFCGNCGQSF